MKAALIEPALMKSMLISFCLMLVTALPARSDAAWVALSPIPYGFVVPKEIASRLSTGRLVGRWAEEVKRSGARGAVSVYYQPESGAKTILFTTYYFPADRWDAAQKPGSPPPFGEPVFRGDGRVLSVAGPLDVVYDPATPDGKRFMRAVGLLQDPANFQPVE